MNHRTARALKHQAIQRRQKHGNVPVEVEGIGRVHSKAELRRFRHLQMLMEKGEIYQLKRQVPFKLVVNGELICSYIADATFYRSATDEYVVEDVKSPHTRKLADYRIKKKLMKAIYKIDIQEYMR